MAFDKVDYSLLLNKMEQCALDGPTTRWIQFPEPNAGPLMDLSK